MISLNTPAFLDLNKSRQIETEVQKIVLLIFLIINYGTLKVAGKIL
jgi:hypothetical protein